MPVFSVDLVTCQTSFPRYPSQQFDFNTSPGVDSLFQLPATCQFTCFSITIQDLFETTAVKSTS